MVEAVLAADLLAVCAAALNKAFPAPAIARSITAGVSAIDASVGNVAELDTALHAATDALEVAGGNLTMSAATRDIAQDRQQETDDLETRLHAALLPPSA